MPQPPKPHPLKPSEVRKKANAVALKRWPDDGDTSTHADTGEAYREGIEHGYELGAAYAERMIAKHGERR